MLSGSFVGEGKEIEMRENGQKEIRERKRERKVFQMIFWVKILNL